MSIFKTKKIKKRKSQKQRILELLERNQWQWVSVVEILRLRPRIACYTMRISELRRDWYQIFNKTMWIKEKDWHMVKYSKYLLIWRTNETNKNTENIWE